ncbi:MAG: conjugal transfer protein TraR [Firmicutes bacterium]|nr:conjugal transfer protein TraR [Bacillota bacterium]
MQNRKVKARLQAEKRRLKHLSTKIKQEGLSQGQGDSLGELSLYDNHPADVGTETFERGKDIGLWDNIQRLETQVDRALKKLGSGTYGICEHCGQKIDPARLEILPWATLCYHCGKEEGKTRPDSQRPVEEDVLAQPFSRTFRADIDDSGFDREDAWEAVARYGTSSRSDDENEWDS